MSSYLVYSYSVNLTKEQEKKLTSKFKHHVQTLMKDLLPALKPSPG
jgi:hypothetical protein